MDVTVAFDPRQMVYIDVEVNLHGSGNLRNRCKMRVFPSSPPC
jgi:hypothetical protein